jgi:hypothetical protein
MDDQLSFDVYAEIADPRCRIEHDAHDRRVSVVIGGSSRESSTNMLQLWFTEPDTAIKLGRKLISAGMRLKAQLSGAPTNTEVSRSDEDPKECASPHVAGGCGT